MRSVWRTDPGRLGVGMADRVIILGAGLAGLSAAYHLDAKYEIYEKETEAGGLCRSKSIDGFVFDRAVHTFYSRDEYSTALVKKLLTDNFSPRTRSAWIYSKGIFTPYPFQANTFGLPIEVVKECVLEFIKAKYDPDGQKPAANFEEWIYSTFGQGIADHFMIPFNRKLWAVDLKEMSARWIDDRVPRPSLEEVLEGALHRQERSFGPNAQFWYPRNGGIGALPQAFLPHIKNLQLHQEVTAIYPDERRIMLENGRSRNYHRLIPSLPLPKLVDMIKPIPEVIKEAADQLNTIPYTR